MEVERPEHFKCAPGEADISASERMAMIRAAVKEFSALSDADRRGSTQHSWVNAALQEARTTTLTQSERGAMSEQIDQALQQSFGVKNA